LWRTKPTDRFVLRWIKLHLSAPLTCRLAGSSALQPKTVTLVAASSGVAAGVALALGHPLLGGCLGAAGQILDGVDGQLARLRGSASARGAFWDSVLDRYADGALVFGLGLYILRHPAGLPQSLLLLLFALAIIGSNLISYSSARASSLALDLGGPTRASKGTRTTVIIVAAWATPLTSLAPAVALLYLAVHPQVEVLRRLRRAGREQKGTSSKGEEPLAATAPAGDDGPAKSPPHQPKG